MAAVTSRENLASTIIKRENCDNHSLPYKGLQDATIFLVTDVLSDGLFVYARVFPQKFSHFLGIYWKGEQTMFLQELNPFLWFVVELFRASLENLNKSQNRFC